MSRCTPQVGSGPRPLQLSKLEAAHARGDQNRRSVERDRLLRPARGQLGFIAPKRISNNSRAGERSEQYGE